MIMHSPSSSTMVTIAWWSSLMLTFMGNEWVSIVSINFSFLSKTMSSTIVTLKVALIIPAMIERAYGPGA